MWKKKTTKILALAGLSVILGIGALVYAGFVLEGLGAELTANMQLFADNAAREQEYRELQRTLANTEEERSALRSLVLHGNDDTVNFLSEIDELAAALGVTLITEELKVRSPEGAPFDQLDVTFAIEGPRAQTARLIELFESLPYHSYIRTLSVEYAQDETTGVSVMESTVILSVTMESES